MVADKWDKRMLALAALVSGWSKDPSTKVGSVIVRDDRTIASIGYNGFPRDVLDDNHRYCNRDIKYGMVVHAEANAIVSSREPLHGCTIYCTHAPCSSCSGLIIQSGIARVVAPMPSADMMERWKDSYDIAFTMLDEAFVELVLVTDE